MTPSELKYNVERTENDPFYFTHDTMKFWGDKMSNYGTRAAVVIVDGQPVDVWELWRKRPVRNGQQGSAYFRRDNFAQVFPDRD